MHSFVYLKLLSSLPSEDIKKKYSCTIARDSNKIATSFLSFPCPLWVCRFVDLHAKHTVLCCV